jgi:hypothetical protein
MNSAVIFTLLLVAFQMRAQVLTRDARVVIMAEPPSLPAVTQDVLPGEGFVSGMHTLSGEAVVFDTWKPLRRRLAVLRAGTRVMMLSGLSEVSKPDVITVTAPIPELQLEPGDRLLRYTELGEGNADFWTKGRWYGNLDGAFVTNADGSGCQSQCKARVVESGRKKWWFRVRLRDGRVGWIDASESFGRVH